MELAATGRSFLYVPLQNHFEQQVHVRHRLERHRAGRAIDFATSTAESMADDIVRELSFVPDYEPVPADGARRAAAMLVDLL